MRPGTRSLGQRLLGALAAGALLATMTPFAAVLGRSAPADRGVPPHGEDLAVEYDGMWGTRDVLSGTNVPFSQYFGLANSLVPVVAYQPTPPNASIVFRADTHSLVIGIENGPLTVGVYEDASIGAFQPGKPRLDVGAAQQMDCPGSSPIGRFAILEAPVVVNAVVTQFAADFEITCNGQSQLRGGVRFHSPTPFHALDPAVTHDASWPLTIPINAQMAQTVTISNLAAPWDGPMTIGAPAIEGPDAAAFILQSTSCVSGVLAPGASCTAQILFDPRAEGTAHAMLAIPTDLPLGAVHLDLQATAGPEDHLAVVGPTTVSPGTFYPYPDGYRDTARINGSVGEWCHVQVDVRTGGGTLVRRFSVAGLVHSQWWTTWNGKNNAGTRVAAGTYKITTVYTDLAGNVGRSPAVSVVVSSKRLVTYAKTLSRAASEIATNNGLIVRGLEGTGRISTASAYYHGRKLTSGSAGYAALGYAFTLPSATVYSRLTLKVTGRSPNGRQGIIGLQNFGYGYYWNTQRLWVIPVFDARALAGPGLATWAASTTNTKYYRYGRIVHAIVYVVPTASGASQAFDFSTVKLTVTYKLLQ